MRYIRTDTAGVIGLGTDIVGMAGGVDGATAAVGAPHGVEDPPATASALAELMTAYRRSTQRLRDDVVALGRLTQAAGAEYDAVESAAARLHAAEGSASTADPAPTATATTGRRPHG